MDSVLGPGEISGPRPPKALWEGMGGLVGGHELIGDESEAAARDHLSGKVFHDRLGLDMEVAEHLI